MATIRIILILSMLWLAACGNKGPLYLPDAEPVVEKPGMIKSEPSGSGQSADEPESAESL